MRYTHYAIIEQPDHRILVLLKKKHGVKRITYYEDECIEIIETEVMSYFHSEDISYKKLTPERFKKIQPILVAQLQESINDLGNKDIVFHSVGAAKKITPKAN